MIAGQRSSNVNFFEFDIGGHSPQAKYDKYTDAGISLRFVYSHRDIDFPFVRYDFELQYLQFRRDTWYDQFVLSSGFPGPLVEVKNSEQSFSLSLGPRLMSPTVRGFFRPYISLKGGIFYFYESVTWEWDDDGDFFDWVFDDECDDDCDDNSNTEIIDSEFHFGWMLELGANLFPKRKWGFDIGMQYTVIPAIERPRTYYYENEKELGYISRKINADYVSIYIGMSFPINKHK